MPKPYTRPTKNQTPIVEFADELHRFLGMLVSPHVIPKESFIYWIQAQVARYTQEQGLVYDPYDVYANEHILVFADALYKHLHSFPNQVKWRRQVQGLIHTITS